MNINDFRKIENKINKKVHCRYNLMHVTLKRMDLSESNHTNLSEINTISKARHTLSKDFNHCAKKAYNSLGNPENFTYFCASNQRDCYRGAVIKLGHFIDKGYIPSTAILLKSIQVDRKGIPFNAFQPIVLTKAVLFHIIKKHAFITAGQLEADFAKAMRKLPEEPAINIEKKVNLSRHYLTIKAAVPDKAILNISSVLADHNSIKELMRSASHVYTDVQETVPYIKEESQKASNLLHDVKSIINTQIDGKSAYMMFTTTKLEMNEKYMQMSHKHLADAVRKRQLI